MTLSGAGRHEAMGTLLLLVLSSLHVSAASGLDRHEFAFAQTCLAMPGIPAAGSATGTPASAFISVP